MKQSNNNKGANGPGKHSKNNLRGNVAKLGSSVYTYGYGDQGDSYIKTTEVIAEYVGREYSKKMQILVKDKKETMPVEPSTKERREQVPDGEILATVESLLLQL